MGSAQQRQQHIYKKAPQLWQALRGGPCSESILCYSILIEIQYVPTVFNAVLPWSDYCGALPFLLRGEGSKQLLGLPSKVPNKNTQPRAYPKP